MFTFASDNIETINMKTIILLCVLTLTSFSMLAQKGKNEPASPQLPVSETTGLITYAERVEAQGMNRQALYDRALAWANAYFKNPAEVIREKDAAEGHIVIKARFRISNPADKKGVVTQAGNVMYTLIIKFRDNAWRYEFTSMNWQQTSAFPIERWLDTSAPSYSGNYPHYLSQTDAAIREVEKALVSSMAASGSKKTDDW
jgi:hypothetical protein